jgi:hypothetical protein
MPVGWQTGANAVRERPVTDCRQSQSGGFKEGPGAKALLNTLALFVRLKPHAPSEKAKMRLFIRLAGYDSVFAPLVFSS